MANILLVDDEENVRLFYRSVLEEDGHNIDEEENIENTLKKVTEKDFDLVILDIKLNQESGLDLLQRLNKVKPDLPIILCTAYSSYQDDFTSWLAQDYVVKSSDPKTLKQAVNKVLGSKDLK